MTPSTKVVQMVQTVHLCDGSIDTGRKAQGGGPSGNIDEGGPGMDSRKYIWDDEEEF